MQLYEPRTRDFEGAALTSRAGRRRGIPVSCAANGPSRAVTLPRAWLHEFSMTPGAIPLAKQVLRGLRVADATRVAARALRATTAAEVERVLVQSLSPQELPR